MLVSKIVCGENSKPEKSSEYALPYDLLGGIYRWLPKAGMCWTCITFCGCMEVFYVTAFPDIGMETLRPGQ